MKATTFILQTEVFIRVSGVMAKNKDLVNWLSKINMDTLVNGNKTKKREKANISIQMAKSMKVVG